jgi:pectinesterase
MARPSWLILVILLCAAPTAPQSDSYDYVVAKDGSGDYTSIQAAIDGAKSFPPERITIFVKDGVYREKVTVHAWNPRITLIGESKEKTILTYDDHFDKINRGRNSTFFTYTLMVQANDFRARNLTVKNSAGPVGQALALRVEGDRVVFENCRFLGHQDTIYVAGAGHRQYFKDCYIEGTTDFIFGQATAVFEDCRIHSTDDSYITAASTPKEEPFGLVFLDCRLTAAPDVEEVYLGRPWRKYAQTVFLRSEMGAHIRPEGWNNWSKPEAEQTAFYAEYDNSGPGADRSGRVAWAKQLSEDEAARYTTATIFGGGDEWFRSPSEGISWDDILDQEGGWYGGEEAIRIADNVLLYQHESGGWPKNIDMARQLSASETDDIRQEQAAGGTTLSDITIDNGATYTQIRYLARVYEATGEQRFAEGVQRGVDYLLEAQYENGGWPQYYPLRDGYYENITFNDGAMIGAMRVLRDVAEGENSFSFVDSSRRQRAATAVEQGVDVILEMQIEVEGTLTAWCAQYDPETLKPVGARSYEPPSISGGESVGVVEYLMEMEAPSPEVIRAVESAVDWFERVKLTDVRLLEIKDASVPEGEDVVVGFDPSDDTPLWARFYEIGTNRPIFMDREGTVYRALSQVPYERRTGYDWLGDWPLELLNERYPVWRSNHNLE